MLIWLHRHYFVVWLAYFAVLFLLFGGWQLPRALGWICKQHDNGNVAPLQILVMQICGAFIGACILCGITGFTYHEDPDYLYAVGYYESR